MGPGPLDYACAKAGGVLSRSFVGPALAALASRPSLSEAAQDLFPGEAPQKIPDGDYASELQSRCAARSLADRVRLLDSVRTPSILLVEALRGAEAEFLRECVAAEDGGRAAPAPPDLGRFSTIDRARSPDIGAMFSRSGLLRALESRAKGRSAELDAAIGAYRSDALLAAARRRPAWSAARRLVEEEAQLRNAAWALRLRVSYGYGPDGVAPLLSGGPGERGAAMQSFRFPLDSREAWSQWKFASLLGEGRVDPLVFERRSSARLRALEMAAFRSSPLGEDRIYAFMRIKEREVASVTSAIEGILLGVSRDRMLQLLGVAG